jgi:galactokinase
MVAAPESIVESYERFIGPLSDDAVVAKAPGRIEVLGNHTDYNGGRMLSATIDRFVWTLGMAADEVRLHSAQLDGDAVFSPDEIEPVTEDGWSKYVRGLYWSFDRRKHRVRGFRGVVSGDVPIGAGLGSSAALSVSLANAIALASEQKLNPKALAMLAFESERIFCRVPCGIQDQFTSQLGKKNSLLAIYSSRLLTQHVLAPDGIDFLVINSMISRDADKVLTARREECRQALAALNEAGFALWNLSAIAPEDLAVVEEILDEPLSLRVKHIVGENSRVVRGVEALNAGDLTLFGELMNDSHESSKELYDVSHPNLDMLVTILRSKDSVVGARLTGAGFGGSVIAAVRTGLSADAGRSTLEDYERETGILGEGYLCNIPGGVAANRVSDL